MESKATSETNLLSVLAANESVHSLSVVLEHHFVFAHQESNRTPQGLGFDPTSLGFNPNVTTGLPSKTFPQITATRISGMGPTGGLEKIMVLLQNTQPLSRSYTDVTL